VVKWFTFKYVVKWFTFRYLVKWFTFRYVVEWFTFRYVIEWFTFKKAMRIMQTREEAGGRMQWLQRHSRGGLATRSLREGMEGGGVRVVHLGRSTCHAKRGRGE